MYLKIGENQYSCTKRIKSASGTLKFLGVSLAPVYTPEEYAQAWEVVET